MLNTSPLHKIGQNIPIRGKETFRLSVGVSGCLARLDSYLHNSFIFPLNRPACGGLAPDEGPSANVDDIRPVCVYSKIWPRLHAGPQTHGVEVADPAIQCGSGWLVRLHVL